MKPDVSCSTLECCGPEDEDLTKYDESASVAATFLPAPPPPVDCDFGCDNDPLIQHEFSLSVAKEAAINQQLGGIPSLSSAYFSSDVGYIVHTPSPPPPPPSIICYCSSCCSTSRRNLSPRNRLSIPSCPSAHPPPSKDRWCNSMFVTTGCCRCQYQNNNKFHFNNNSCCGQPISATSVHHRLQQEDNNDCTRFYLNDDKVSYEDQVTEQGGERVAWEFQQVKLSRVPGYGFGIAVSGGTDNPHFANGDPSIAVSDVLKAGPAEGKLMVNDRITSVNGISLENVVYGRAVQVLRDSGHTITLSVRRRFLLPSQEPHILRLQLNKRSKKDDFGILLDNHIYIKQIKSKLETITGPALREGDIILKINNQPTDNLSLKEARKLLESSKEKLYLTVRREATASSPYPYHQTKDINCTDMLNGNTYGVQQNLYVQPPTRQQNVLETEKSNLMPRMALSRNLNHSYDDSVDNDYSHSLRRNINQGSHDSFSSQHTLSKNRHVVEDQEPPRPPPPRLEDYYGISKMYEDEMNNIYRQSPYPVEDPRFVIFQKEGSLGIQLIGGNEVGIFVTAVQPDSPASLQGLRPGDKILKANDLDMKGVTREEAVLFLLNMQDQVELIVQNRTDEYEKVVAHHLGDSFHFKAHLNYDQPNEGGMSFHKGDIFYVTDTMHNDVIGSWQVYRIGRNNQQVQKGIIPNKARAEELATAQFNATKKVVIASESHRIGFFRRRRRNNNRRSKSLSKDHWDDVVFGNNINKFPAYERVILKHPGFIRPVVLFGPVADIAREKLLKDFPDKFSAPQIENPLEDVSKKASGIIKLSAIRSIIDSGKHALLDITPNAVDRLNFAQFYPIVILLRPDSKQVIKELRVGVPKSAHKSSRKLFEQSQKLEKSWSHVFCGSINLSTTDSWYRKLCESIEKYQSSSVWISKTKPEETLSDDEFLFPMTMLRVTYASSPESDLEQVDPKVTISSEAPLSPSFLKYSSDPSLAMLDDDTLPSYNPPPAYTAVTFANQNGYEANGFGTQPSLTGATPPDLPPRLDRVGAPKLFRSATIGGRSAQEGLFSDDGAPKEPKTNYEITSLHRRLQNLNSLERHNSSATCDKTTSSYNNSILSNQTYKQRSMSNLHDVRERTTSSNDRTVHDPYRYTRSTQQPIKSSTHTSSTPSKPSGYSRYRPSDSVEHCNTNKPSPPPKPTQAFKPVPPPKPKNYLLPTQHHTQQISSQPYLQQSVNHASSLYDEHATAYCNNYNPRLINGTSSSSASSKYSLENSDSNGLDSGNGSSLDRRTGAAIRSNSSQYFYSVPPASTQLPDLSGLDLTHRQQPRTSAFELYKKPIDHGNIPYYSHTNHSIR